MSMKDNFSIVNRILRENKMQNNTIILPAVLAGSLAFMGCASTKSTLQREVLDTTEQIAYVKDGNALYLVNGQGNKIELLLEMNATIAAPIWSPNGKNIVFYSYAKTQWPFSNQKMELLLYNMASKEYQHLGDFEFEVKRTGSGQGILIFPPNWSPDGKFLYLTDKNGIYRINLAGERTQLVHREKLKGAAFSPNGLQIAYTDGKTIFLASEDGKNELELTETLKPFETLTARDIKALAYSPDGSKLAIGERNRLIMLHLDTLRATQLHTASYPIYWMSWLSNKDRLLFLTGLPNAKRGLGGTEYGGSSLFSISAAGTDLSEIYDYPYIDVRDVCPSLSSDKRYVALISKPVRGNQKIFIVATDGSGWMELTKNGKCLYPAWRPNVESY